MQRSEQIIMVFEGNASFAHHTVIEEYYNQLIRYATPIASDRCPTFCSITERLCTTKGRASKYTLDVYPCCYIPNKSPHCVVAQQQLASCYISSL